MVSLPNILFQVGVVDMGDLEFIQEKVIAGDYFQVSGNIDALNDTIEFIVPNGKTAFMIEAKIMTPTILPALDAPTDDRNSVMASLKLDSIEKDRTITGFTHQIGGSGNADNANAMVQVSDGRFNVLGLSLVGDGIKKIEIENIEDEGTAVAVMSGYLIDT